MLAGVATFAPDAEPAMRRAQSRLAGLLRVPQGSVRDCVRIVAGREDLAFNLAATTVYPGRRRLSRPTSSVIPRSVSIDWTPVASRLPLCALDARVTERDDRESGTRRPFRRIRAEVVQNGMG
jgi:hypothetical protein